jgi:hypothetical protein
MAKAELTTIEAVCDGEHHSLLSCGSICGLFSCVLDDFLFNYSYCFPVQIFPLQNVFLGGGTTQLTSHPSLDSGWGQA